MIVNWALPAAVMKKLLDSMRNGAVQEVEAVVLAGFSGTDDFKLTFGGNESGIITRGTNYTAAGIKTAIEAITAFSGTVTVSDVTDTAFLVTWDVPGAVTSVLSVTSPHGCTGTVGILVAGADASEGDRVSLKGSQLHAFSNDVNVTPATVLADLTESAFDGYAASGEVQWAETYFAAGGVCQFLGSLIEWVATGTGTVETVYGVYLERDGELLAAGRLSVPVPISAIGSTVVIFPQVSFSPATWQSLA